MFCTGHTELSNHIMCIYYKSEKTFPKNAKICRDDYAKKYSNKVYVGMAVCKGRGDEINTKLNIHSPIPTSFFTCHGNCSTIHNYGYVVRCGLYRTLHLGSVAYNSGYIQLATTSLKLRGGSACSGLSRFEEDRWL